MVYCVGGSTGAVIAGAGDSNTGIDLIGAITAGEEKAPCIQRCSAQVEAVSALVKGTSQP